MKNIDKSVCKELEKNQRDQQFYFLKICFNCPVRQDFHAQDWGFTQLVVQTLVTSSKV